MNTKHVDVKPGAYARVTFGAGLAFFTGHAAPQFDTVKGQTEAVLKRYDELFAAYGLKKDRILYSTCFMKDADLEPEFADAYFAWIDPANPPAGVTVTGIPIQHSPVGDNVLVELAFIVATDDAKPIVRHDVTRGSRMVEYDGMAYFTGHVSPKADTLGGQVEGVLKRYDELFEKFGLHKENVIAANSFIKDMSVYSEMAAPWNAYFGENPPAGVAVHAAPNQKTGLGDLQIELALFVATGDHPHIVRHDVVPGMPRVVEYNGLAWFTGHGARPDVVSLKDQTAAVCARYDELFKRFGYDKENILMEYGYLRDIEEVGDYLSARAAWCPENPPAGVVVEASPAGDTCRVELQFIVALEGEGGKDMEKNAKGQKDQQIFGNRGVVTDNDKTAKARADVAADPTNADKYMALGLALRGQMYFREAVEAYSIGLTYDPFKALLYRHRGHAYVNLGQYQEAAADFVTGLRMAPTNWDCWYHLGLAYHLMGAYDRALTAYERCYDLSPSDEFRICTTDWYCMTLMKMGRVDDMRKAAARIHKDMDPGMSEGYFDRCLVYNGTRTADEVLAEAEAKDDHMYATGAYGIAVYYEYVLGEKAKAKAILEKIAGRDATWGGFAEHAAADQLKVWVE